MAENCRKGKKLLISSYGEDPLTSLKQTKQVKYLRCYLADLGAKTALEEPQYFDRDYLDEFSSFYSTSSHGYANVCRRVHYFDKDVTRDAIRNASAGKEYFISQLNKSYLGFIVIRPIQSAPLGRTVLKSYPDNPEKPPRITRPSRPYICHLAGFELKVEGLAWQQQDSAVGACATIGLWSLLHSSAFDDNHAIPTTAEITRAANRASPVGTRVFPSNGLQITQLSGAIKELGLAPVILSADSGMTHCGKELSAFTRERFSSTCAAFIRSGYPVIIVGELVGLGWHAVCATGFREAEEQQPKVNEILLLDHLIEHLYIHDDNIGPSVRFKVHETHNGCVYLKTDPPPVIVSDSLGESPTKDHPVLVPNYLIVSVHDDLRTSPDTLHRSAITVANELCEILNAIIENSSGELIGLILGSRFMLVYEYIGKELKNTILDKPNVLAKTRLSLQEKVKPMSLFVGVVRLALSNSVPLADILYDTSDSDRNHPVFAFVSYHPAIDAAYELMSNLYKKDYGQLVQAH